MRIAFFEQRDQRWLHLKRWLGDYSLRRGLDFSVLRFFRRNVQEVLAKYALGINIAFISLDDEEGTCAGMALARLNPQCFICYYAQKECAFQPLLHSRPFDFHFGTHFQSDMDVVMDAMLSEYIRSSGVFSFETKRGFFYYSINNILYFQSDLKYVHVVEACKIETEIAEQDCALRLYTRLNDIEAELSKQEIEWCFVRIHKSYLVNRFHIVSVDKQSHAVRLKNGEMLPISASFYREAVNQIRSLCTVGHEGAD